MTFEEMIEESIKGNPMFRPLSETATQIFIIKLLQELSEKK